MKRLFFLLAAAAAFWAPAGRLEAQAQWEAYAESPHGSRYYLDLESLDFQTDPTYALVWSKEVSPSGGHQIARIQLYPATRQFRLVGLVCYDASGHLTGYYDKPGAWTAIVPDSVMGILYGSIFSRAEREEKDPQKPETGQRPLLNAAL